MQDPMRVVRLRREPDRRRRSGAVTARRSGQSEPTREEGGTVEREVANARARARRRHPSSRGRPSTPRASRPTPHLGAVPESTVAPAPCRLCAEPGHPIRWGPVDGSCPPPIVRGGPRRPLLAPAWECSGCGFRWGDDGEQADAVARLGR